MRTWWTLDKHLTPTQIDIIDSLQLTITDKRDTFLNGLTITGHSLIITRGGLLISGKVSAGILRPPIGWVLDSTPPLSEGVWILRPPLSEGSGFYDPPPFRLLTLIY